jgi:enhancing lycopene biosynthesis protein 2
MQWSGNEAEEQSAGSFVGHIQQAKPETAETIGETWSQVFTVWCPVGTSVQEGDKVVVSTGAYAETYYVRQIMKNAVGINQHLELVLSLKK